VSPENKKDPMDVDGVVDALNHALRLQLRSALAYTLTAGSFVGLRFVPLSEQLAVFGRSELDDARRLVEKIVSPPGPAATPTAMPRCDGCWRSRRRPSRRSRTASRTRARRADPRRWNTGSST
jgi:hypothetical protein